MPSSEPSRRTVLLVEDDRAIRERLRLHLDAAGFAVDESVEGTDALGRLRGRAYDLIVLDVMLPGLDGVSVCRAVRNAGPTVRRPS